MAEDKDESGSTTVTTVDLDINDVLGMPGAENVMIPSTGETKVEKPSIFTKNAQDLSFLDKTEEETDADDSATSKEEKEPLNADEIKSQLDSFSSEEETASSKSGRPKTNKEGLVELTKKLIDAKQIIPFDDDKDLEDYTLQDFQELLEENFKEKERKLRNEIPVQFFDSLPEELQYAAKYVADGGTDLKNLFRTLAQVEEVRQLDPSDEMDQEQIVRAYLHATQFGSAEDIEEEITSWKDRGELDAKASKFKPKLDAMQEKVMARQLQQQEMMRKQQQQQAEMYMDNIYKTLEPGELNGLKLDKKTQSMLYAGLIQPNYPSISGRPTNLLGHLLEKYQYVEPRHDLIAEALWLLSDPEGYRSKLKAGGKKEADEKTVRMLKSEEARKITSSTGTTEKEETESRQTRLARPSGKDFFKR